MKLPTFILASVMLTACSSKPSAEEMNNRINKQIDQIEELQEKRQYHFDQAKIFLDLGDLNEHEKQMKKANEIDGEIMSLEKKFEEENKDFQ